MALADSLVVMNRGRIEDQGPPERIYAQPATYFTAGFMGEVTTLSGRVTDPCRAKTPVGTLPVPRSFAAGSEVRIAIRPENLIAGGDPVGRQSFGELRIGEIVFQGPAKRLLGEVGPPDAPIPAIVRVPASTQLSEGERVPLWCDPAHILTFEA